MDREGAPEVRAARRVKCATCTPLKDKVIDILPPAKWQAEAARRIRLGQTQRLCPTCRRWYFPRRHVS